MVCKPFPKKRLNEGLQFTVDSFLHHATIRCHWGRHKPSFHRAAGSLCPNLVLGQMYTEHLLCRALRRPWIQLWTGSQGASSERIFTEMEILLQSFGTSWMGLQWMSLCGMLTSLYPMSSFILSSWSGVRSSILQCSVIISAGRLSEWYIFWAHVFLILYHFYSIDDRVVN